MKQLTSCAMRRSAPSNMWASTPGEIIHGTVRGACIAVMLTAQWMVVPASHAQSDTKVVITTERAPSVGGPWQTVVPVAEERNADGNPVLSVTNAAEFYKSRIEILEGHGSALAVPMDEVDPEPLAIALQHLTNFMAGAMSTDSEAGDGFWENAELAPFAYPVFDPHINGGTSPAYLEFKVVSSNVPPVRDTSFFKSDPGREPYDIGFILVSLTDQDVPIPEFATSGPTPVEQLARLAGRTDFRPIRFGGTFLVAEGFDGELIANLGAEPFKPDPRILDTLGYSQFSRGSDETDEFEKSPNLELSLGGYSDYAEFLGDYLTNAVYLHFRDRRTAMAHPFWQALREGIAPDAVEVAVGESIVRWSDVSVGEYSLMVETGEAIAELVPIAGSPGLQITGLSEGQGVLRLVGADSQVYQALLRVTPAGAAPLLLSPTIKFYPLVIKYATTWATGPQYHQAWSHECCPLSGCGPTAWSILLGWFERQKHVAGAFGNMLYMDAPYKNTENPQLIRTVQENLHDHCDVICPPCSDQGATTPGDMFAGIDYLYIQALTGIVKRHYQMSYDLGDDCPPYHGLLCRNAIRDGKYPAILGLGWMWHYVVAYGYAYQKIEIPSLGYVTTRYLKCNMGWGPNSDPRWYNMCDTFWGANINIWDGPNAP